MNEFENFWNEFEKKKLQLNWNENEFLECTGINFLTIFHLLNISTFIAFFKLFFFSGTVFGLKIIAFVLKKFFSFKSVFQLSI